MKKIFLLMACLLALNAMAQQKLNTFHLIDDSTRKAIPSVSVTIIRAGLSIMTEKDGIFSIPGDLGKMRDTVLFFAQHYEPVKLQLRDLSNMDTIRLKKIVSLAKNTKLRLKKDTLLNDYDKAEIAHYAGLRANNPAYEFLQLAQRFEAPKAGALLKYVSVYRLEFALNYGNINDTAQYRFTQLEHTKFRIRVYDVDPATDGPGKDLCDQIIEIKNNSDQQLGTSLSRYNIVIPNKVFFVAIEWIRDYYNADYVRMYDPKEDSFKEYKSFKPSIGISPQTGKKLNIWALDFTHRWKPYSEFLPLGTDLAIKVNTEY